MRITILSHNLSSNAAMRAHRLATAARTFADVKIIGPMENGRPWPALPMEPWIHPVVKRRFPKFAVHFLELVDAADADVLVAVKPHLPSYGVALVAGAQRGTPVILDIDDLDVALAPRSTWKKNPSAADVRRPGSVIYASLLTRATGAASAITVASHALKRRFGGTVVPHGCLSEKFDPSNYDREQVRQEFGFTGRVVLFPGTPRSHKGVEILAQAVDRTPGCYLAALCRPKDLAGPRWARHRLIRLPMMGYADLPRVLAAADVVAITESDNEAAQHQTPMKVFDAMAMGRPIVANAVSDLPGILDGCARLVPPGDVDAMADAIRRLLENGEESAQLGQGARQRCLSEYSMPRVAEILKSVFQAALENRHSETP